MFIVWASMCGSSAFSAYGRSGSVYAIVSSPSTSSVGQWTAEQSGNIPSCQNDEPRVAAPALPSVILALSPASTTDKFNQFTIAKR
jgi:hypothetical protein